MGDYEADAPTPSGSDQPNRGPDSERLLALLEVATEGSRELDAEIGALVGLCDLHLDDGTWFYGLDLNDDHGPWEECPSYTTSIDAALTLLPKGAHWCVNSAPCGQYRAEVDWGDSVWTASGPLALCIASIRALAPPDARASGASAQESKDFPP